VSLSELIGRAAQDAQIGTRPRHFQCLIGTPDIHLNIWLFWIFRAEPRIAARSIPATLLAMRDWGKGGGQRAGGASATDG